MVNRSFSVARMEGNLFALFQALASLGRCRWNSTRHHLIQLFIDVDKVITLKGLYYASYIVK